MGCGSFLSSAGHFFVEMIPALAIGFFVSGIIHEFVPGQWIQDHLGKKGFRGILWSAVIGTLSPVCCWGCLPIAISLRKKGATLGPVLAILIATPATSISALLVTAKLLGTQFAIALFFSVIGMAVAIGLIGDKIQEMAACTGEKGSCGCAGKAAALEMPGLEKRSLLRRCVSVLTFAFIQMPRDIGKEVLLGVALGAAVESVAPIGYFVHHYLAGAWGYIFAVVFGLLTYICATMGVPLVDALMRQGLERGAGFVLLLIGPVTSLGTMLVLKKEFGWKVLGIYVGLVCSFGLIAGWLFSLL